MSPTARTGFRTLLLGGVACAVLLACGDDSLEAAGEELREMRQRVEQAQARVDKREEDARAAEKALQQAREALDEAEAELAETQKRVAKKASDAVVFREVQRRLLEDDALESVAISARVSQHVVTLEGSVPNEKLAQRAEEIASKTPGVQTVVNQIRVASPAPATP